MPRMAFYAVCTATALVLQTAFAQSSESIRIPGDSDSCNVVNLNFAGSTNQEQGQPGPPGERGQVGLKGNAGVRGPKGEQGLKGEPGEEVNEAMLETMSRMGASNCKELESKYGITEKGHYVIRSPESAQAIYVLCDFQIREGVSTCQELHEKYRINESGFYYMNPGGGTLPFQIFCNMSSKDVITEVWHDKMREIRIPGCEAYGCYSTRPRYYVDSSQALAVISKSRECKQYIKFRCIGAVLVFDKNSPRGWWASRDGEKMTYWGGATSRRKGYCACGETGSCVNNGYKCNCDNNSREVSTQDEGYLTDKNKLPVSEMRFGDLGDATEYGWHTLGSLECMGKA